MGWRLLSKYHAIFIPLGTFLYIVLHRPKRRWLVQPGPYLAIALGLVMFSPVIVWNANHGWVSFLFQGGRAVGGWMPRPDYLGEALLAQAGYLFPWIWIPLIIILVRDCRAWPRIRADHERLWLCLAVVPVGVFTAVACFRPVLPHWGLIGLASLFPLLGRDWAARLEKRSETTRRFLFASACASVGLLSLAIAEYRYGWLQRGADGRFGLVDTSTDPTLDLYGWDQVADRIDQLGLIDDPRTFVFARYWYQSAQLSAALDKKCDVLCYNAADPRGFAFWSRPQDWVGRDGVLVVVGEREVRRRPVITGRDSRESSRCPTSGSSGTASPYGGLHLPLHPATRGLSLRPRSHRYHRAPQLGARHRSRTTSR